ncbi:hypothetical protein KY328_06025 [Candidatus Woesearchaeota archaeon]|nr:hypothetical protein [Candidatus Woesearchaeota archaeon]MBW3022458.1 hypothetical protein [Candidatus Woesearchaeota archaeon]
MAKQDKSLVEFIHEITTKLDDIYKHDPGSAGRVMKEHIIPALVEKIEAVYGESAQTVLRNAEIAAENSPGLQTYYDSISKLEEMAANASGSAKDKILGTISELQATADDLYTRAHYRRLKAELEHSPKKDPEEIKKRAN